MKVAWAGTFDSSTQRNRRLAEYLEEVDAEVTIFRVRVWPVDRADAFRSSKLQIALLMIVKYPILLLKLLLAPQPDLYLVSYPGWVDVLVVKPISMLKRRPLVFDAFISLYDTVVSDRELVGPASLTARICLLVDKLSIRLSDRIIVDTPDHARFLAGLAGVEETRFGIVYVGADEEVFVPVPMGNPGQQSVVLFYGNYIPLQGTEWIVRASAQVRNPNVRFRLIGTGDDKQKAQAVARELAVSNLEFADPVSLHVLAEEIQRASICLGIFGTGEKANRVIPHKVFEGIASQRPVITGATEAVVGTFRSGELALVPVGDPGALAGEIDRLIGDEDELLQLARKGHNRFVTDFSKRPQSNRLRTELELAIRHD